MPLTSTTSATITKHQLPSHQSLSLFFSHPCALLCTFSHPQKYKPLLFNRFRTLHQKTQPPGVHPATWRKMGRELLNRSEKSLSARYARSGQNFAFSEIVVRKEGFEPPRPFGHKILSLARLPVPPLPQWWLYSTGLRSAAPLRF